jgi:ankyrin repeat protein
VIRACRFAFIISLALPLPVFCQQPSVAPKPVDIPKLIDKLVEVTEQDGGYSGSSSSGPGFSPLEREAPFNGGLLFQKPLVRSDALRLIVKEGVRAVPYLIEHLNDTRETKVRIEGGWLFSFGSGFDCNPRTDSAFRPKSDRIDDDESGYHIVTVGDLCFVAIGQIVNREYTVARYIPTAMVVVNSATKSEAIRTGIKRQWAGLTTQKHCDALIADFLKPDSDGRRIGAAKRLAYYYPDALEPIALGFLFRPMYDAWDVIRFLSDHLYQAKSANESQELFDRFIVDHGPAAKVGILRELLKDLESVESFEMNGKKGQPPSYGDQPRKFLISLYGKKPDVRSSEKVESDSISSFQLEQFIKEALIYDHSKKLDQAMHDLMINPKSNDSIALACMDRLVARGFDKEIDAECRRRLAGKKGRDKSDLEAALARIGWTALHVAVNRGDLDEVRSLSADRKLVNTPARNHRMPLHLAVEATDFDAVQILVNAGADVDAKDADGLTPAQRAIRSDQHKIVELLGKHGCSAPDIFLASAFGKVEALDSLLKQSPTIVEQRTDEEEQTPLHLAAIYRQSLAARHLVAAGAKVDEKNKWGMTPLHLAASFEAIDVIKLLLQKGANVRAKAEGLSAEPLHLAVANNRPAAAALLVESGAAIDATCTEQMTSLHVAVDSNFGDVVNVLLNHGASTSARQQEGKTALHLAAEHGYLDIAKNLIAKKADVNVEDNRGWSPLYYAVSEGNARVFELLISRGAKLNLKTKEIDPEFGGGATLLHVAAAKSRVEIAGKLIAAGANVNASDDNGCMPLCEAAIHGSADMVKLLLSHGANVGGRGKNSEGHLNSDTAIHCAAASGRTDVVRLLIDAKAAIDAVDEEGNTPLHYAALSGPMELVRLLLERGANPNLKDRENHTPLDVAKEKKNSEAADLLLKAMKNR